MSGKFPCFRQCLQPIWSGWYGPRPTFIFPLASSRWPRVASARSTPCFSGKIEVVKLIDGVERTLGWRIPGTIFGEVPLALGAPFPGSYRAVEVSRVMRVEAAEYCTLVASNPEVATRMGALARERLGGLQAIAADPPKARVTLCAAAIPAMPDPTPVPRPQSGKPRVARTR